jgi:glycosyltransferase involved in cell wall biosynthesis
LCNRLSQPLSFGYTAGRPRSSAVPIRDPEPHPLDPEPRIVVIGSSTRFLSGISYYTQRLAVTLAERYEVSAILMRQIIPRRFYPGRARVGAAITDVSYPPEIDVVDGVDWHGLGLLRAVRLLLRTKPNVVLFQWWTGAVLHLYLVLATVARLIGAKVVIEYHETQDTGEARIPGAAAYVRLMSRWLTRSAAASVVHSQSDIPQVAKSFGVGDRPIAVIPHGPFDQYTPEHPVREAPPESINLLFFGTIRPYKGLEDLVSAFNGLSADVSGQYWLTVVGETWEGWESPAQLIASSAYRSRITFINRYVTDEELSGFIAGADAVVLPYRRSSASGPLHVTMAVGLPVIVTNVGGLTEAAIDYEGAVFVEPADPGGLQTALGKVAELVGTRFTDPHSWDNTADKYEALFRTLLSDDVSQEPPVIHN